MTTFFCQEFIRDLVRHGDAQFASRVLAKVVSREGQFEHDADDHRYIGIDNCWIRYISRQSTAYRAIFIKRGPDVYWYRAGSHSVENRLRAPEDLSNAVEVSSAPQGLDALVEHEYPRYLKAKNPRLLREVIAARILIPHKSITLVTPRISGPLFSPVGLVGRLISSAVEFGGTVTVITKPPSQRELASYRWLIARGVDLLIHESLNARLYVFDVNRDQLDREMMKVESIGIVGSAELTEAGLGEGAEEEVREELCYIVGEDDLEGSEDYLLRLADNSSQLESLMQGWHN